MNMRAGVKEEKSVWANVNYMENLTHKHMDIPFG